MQEAKGPKTSVLFDLVNPNREMFTRDNEVPIFGIIATHTEFTSIVRVARVRIIKALNHLMENPENKLVIMQQDVIEMESGANLELTKDTLVVSLQYTTGNSKLLHLELSQPNQLTMH